MRNWIHLSSLAILFISLVISLESFSAKLVSGRPDHTENLSLVLKQIPKLETSQIISDQAVKVGIVKNVIFAGDVDSVTPLIKKLCEGLRNAYDLGLDTQEIIEKIKNIPGYEIETRLIPRSDSATLDLQVHLKRVPFMVTIGANTEGPRNRLGSTWWRQPIRIRYFSPFGLHDRLSIYTDDSFLTPHRDHYEFFYTVPIGSEGTDLVLFYETFRSHHKDLNPFNNVKTEYKEIYVGINQLLHSDPIYNLTLRIGYLGYELHQHHLIRRDRNIHHYLNNIWVGAMGDFKVGGHLFTYDLNVTRGFQGLGTYKRVSTDALEALGSVTPWLFDGTITYKTPELIDRVTLENELYYQISTKNLTASLSYYYGDYNKPIFFSDAMNGDNGVDLNSYLKIKGPKIPWIHDISFGPGFVFAKTWSRQPVGIRIKSPQVYGVYGRIQFDFTEKVMFMTSWGMPLKRKSAGTRLKNKLLLKLRMRFKF